MSCISKYDILAQSEQLHRTKSFRRAFEKRLSPAAVTRQARISLLAFDAHSERSEALAFLNGHSAVLNGRPLDIAGASDAGLAAATIALGKRGNFADDDAAPPLPRAAEALTDLLSENPDRGRAGARRLK